MLFKLVYLIALVKFAESQFPQIDFGLEFDKNIIGSNLKVPILFNQNKPLGSQTKLQCLIQQFNSIADYNNFTNKITSYTVCPSDIYNGVKNISVSSPNLSQSTLTYDGNGFDWYLNDSQDSQRLYKLDEFVFQDSTLNYIVVTRFPFNSLKISFTTYLSIFCCDSTYLNTNVPAGQFVYYNKISRFIINVPAGLNSSLILPAVPSTNDLLDPAYKPCNCDLTLNVCDLNCCCDTLCSTDDINAFTIPCQNTKSFTSREIEESFCDDIYSQPKLNKSSWFPILCIHSSTTVLLGKFYSPNLLSSIDFNSDQYKAKRDASYNIKSAYLDSSSLVKTSSYCNLENKNKYSNGICLLKKSSSDTSASDFIRLPENTLSSTSCISDSPVRYLVDKKSFCPITIDENSCANDAKLNIAQYLLNDVLTGNPNSGNSVNIKYQVYECTYKQYFSLPSPTDTVKSCNGIQFSDNSKIFDANFTSLCENYNWTYNHQRLNNIPIDYFLSFDVTKCNKSTSPFNSSIISNDTCQNSVVSVRNIFIWSEGSIASVLQQIIVLKDAPINKKFNQYFEAKWVYNTTAVFQLNSVADYNNYIYGSQVTSFRSGLIGYLNGKPIISGYNNSVNVDYNQRISYFKTINNKLCGINSILERKIINFNENITSSCIVKLTKKDLTNTFNCNALRKIIFNKLNDYFAPANLISKNGNPRTPYNSTDWINLYPNSRYLSVTDSTDDPNKCSNIPYKMMIYFFYSPVSISNQITSSEIIGAYITYSLRNWTFTCKSNILECDLPDQVQDFEIQFETKFINTYSKNLSWLEKCKANSDYSPACIQQVFFTWPNDPTNPHYFYLYSVQLGLLFGVFSFIIIYVMIIGFVCPC